jgi:hypothetical protein
VRVAHPLGQPGEERPGDPRWLPAELLLDRLPRGRPGVRLPLRIELVLLVGQAPVHDGARVLHARQGGPGSAADPLSANLLMATPVSARAAAMAACSDSIAPSSSAGTPAPASIGQMWVSSPSWCRGSPAGGAGQPRRYLRRGVPGAVSAGGRRCTPR